MQKMKVYPVPVKQLPQAWQHAKKWVELAYKKGGGTYPIDDIYNDIGQQKKFLFKCVSTVDDSFCWLIFTRWQNSQYATLNVNCCGGKGALSMLDDLVIFAENLAISTKCKHISLTGRKGWVKELEKYNWHELNRTVGKEL